MKRILSKYWLILFIAVLIAWPAVVISMQRVDPIDEATLNKLESLHEEKLQISNKTIAPPPPEWESEERQQSFRRKYAAFFEAYPVAGGDALQEDLRAVEAFYAPIIRYFDSLTSRTISQDTDFWPRNHATKIQRALAQRAMITNDWDEVLRRLYSSANISNSIREQSLIGMLLATATRAIAYGGYEQLLHADAPIEVKRAALEQLQRLRDTDPFLNKNIALIETLFSLKFRQEMLENPELAKKRLGEDRVAPIYPTQMLVIGAVANLTVLEEQKYVRRWSQLLGPPTKAPIDPALKRWISKRAKESSGASSQYAVYKWTDIPAAERWLKEMVKKEPWIYKTYGFEEETYKQLDPWTLALFSNLNYLGANLEEAQTRARIGATKGRLIEAAFAAQIYQSETGRMPDSITINEKLSPLPETTYEPIRIGVQIITPELPGYNAMLMQNGSGIKQRPRMANLCTNVLPNLGGTWLAPEHDLGIMRWTASFNGQIDEARQKAAEALALKQILGQYPRLVEDARVFVTDRYLSQPKQINSMEDMMNWEPASAPATPTPTPTPTPIPAGAYGYGPYGGYGGYGGPPQPPVPTVSLQFSATLRAPDSVWILWSPGPDGEDDGGTIQYDPTNGTMSRGDLIVFPEVF